VHPIERLRYVARASGIDHASVARETAAALAGLAFDPPGIVTACRRVVERHPASGPVWWMASRVLTAADPIAEAWHVADLLDEDRTAWELSLALPDDATVTVLGWPEVAAGALPRRGDVEVLVVDVLGEGHGLVRALRRADVVADVVAVHALAACVAASDVVLIEASALGPDGFVAIAGSHAAAAVAHHSGTPVWLVAGLGRALPATTWKTVAERVSEGSLEAEDEIVPADLIDTVLGPEGLRTFVEVVASPGCPVAHELLRPSVF
jgi:hypothetical protein